MLLRPMKELEPSTAQVVGKLGGQDSLPLLGRGGEAEGKRKRALLSFEEERKIILFHLSSQRIR